MYHVKNHTHIHVVITYPSYPNALIGSGDSGCRIVRVSLDMFYGRQVFLSGHILLSPMSRYILLTWPSVGS